MTGEQKGALLVLTALGLALSAADHFWLISYLPDQPASTLEVIGGIIAIIDGVVMVLGAMTCFIGSLNP